MSDLEGKADFANPPRDFRVRPETSMAGGLRRCRLYRLWKDCGRVRANKVRPKGRRIRLGTRGYYGVRGEGSNPVPLPPPGSLKPYILHLALWAVKPSSGGEFPFEIRTRSWQSQL